MTPRRYAVVAALLLAAQPGRADPAADAAFLDRALPFTLVETPAPPDDPSNRLMGNSQAERLGAALFNDAGLSRSGDVSCASCHVTNGRSDPNESLPSGASRKFRTSMPVAGAGYFPFLFWDGRKDSLWSQALAPLEHPDEHGLTRTEVAAYLLAHYPKEIAALGATETPGAAALPPASPIGTREQRRAWTALPDDTRDAVTGVFVLAGKAIAAFEATLPPATGDWDRILTRAKDDPVALAEIPAAARRGFDLFEGRARCGTCHAGPLFSDGDFHNTGLSEPDGRPPDLGRQAILMGLLNDEFNCLGRWSDAGDGQCPELTYISLSMERAMGAFRTPTLRGVSRRESFMHSGQFATLEDVLDHYAAAPPGPHGRLIGQGSLSELVPLNLSDQDKADIIAFLKML